MIIKDVTYVEFSMVINPVYKGAMIEMKEPLYVITKNHQQYNNFCKTGIYADRYHYIYILDATNLYGVKRDSTFIKYGEWYDKAGIDAIERRLFTGDFKEIFYREDYLLKKDLT